MHVCVIGAGIAGLTAAFHLNRLGVRTTLLERADHAGGRADVRDGGEHCPRIFLDDYHHLFEVLRQIPVEGGDLLSRLRPVVRYCHTESSGWVRISHLYRFRSAEIPLQDRIGAVRARMRTPLLADQKHPPNTNRYGSLRNYHPRSIARVVANVVRCRDGFALNGATDDLLVTPWLHHLVDRGVDFRPGTTVRQVTAHRDGVLVQTDAGWEPYDEAVVTAYLSDAIDILPSTPLARSRAALPHTHCTSLTIQLDPREPLVDQLEVRLYSRAGLTVLLQPGAARCVVLCVRSLSTDPEWVTGAVSSMLSLVHPVRHVIERPNNAPSEAVYTAEHLPADAVANLGRHIQLAGSYLRSDYPLDSAECAARTAAAAVERIRARYGLRLDEAPVSTAVTRSTTGANA